MMKPVVTFAFTPLGGLEKSRMNEAQSNTLVSSAASFPLPEGARKIFAHTHLSGFPFDGTSATDMICFTSEML
jgi:hypothetical protein